MAEQDTDKGRLIAVTRDVSPRIVECELKHIARAPIDVAVARAQHRRYEACLADLGCDLVRLPAEPDLPDSVFVEDAAIVLDEVAIITCPGAASRRAETASIAGALRPYRDLRHVEPPGTVDGGDLLRSGRTLYVGLSGRTNEAGFDQIRAIVEPLGYRAKSVRVEGCLHLKSAVTEVAEGTLLVNPGWVDGGAFEGRRLIEVDPEETYGANALRIGDVVVYPAAFPRTRRRIEDHGITVRVVDLAELAKAEGAVTCCSLIFHARRRAERRSRLLSSRAKRWRSAALALKP